MPQSLAKVVIHTIFSTKNHQRALLTPGLRRELEGYIVGILRNIGCPSIAVECVADHLHMLYLQSRTVTMANVVGTVKKGSSSWIKEQQRERKDPALLKFHWQNGYAAFSVSESKVAAVKKYIQDQEEHHKRVSFQDEYRTFLKKHNVSYDEQYVWD